MNHDVYANGKNINNIERISGEMELKIAIILLELNTFSPTVLFAVMKRRVCVSLENCTLCFYNIIFYNYNYI